jgi:hypothetical protein
VTSAGKRSKNGSAQPLRLYLPAQRRTLQRTLWTTTKYGLKLVWPTSMWFIVSSGWYRHFVELGHETVSFNRRTVDAG